MCAQGSEALEERTFIPQASGFTCSGGSCVEGLAGPWLGNPPEPWALGLCVPAFGISTLGADQPHDTKGPPCSDWCPECQPCALGRMSPCWLWSEAGREAVMAVGLGETLLGGGLCPVP